MKRVLAAIVATFILLFPHHARTEDTKLTIMVFVGIQNLPLFAAQSQGFFAKHGLDVDMKIAPGSEVLRQGLADGKWQLVHTAFDNAVAMADVAKIDVVGVIGGDNSFNHLIVQPEIGSVIRGSGGIRKLRWSLPGSGKRGGIRVIYFWDAPSETFYMLYGYRKTVKEDLTPQQLRVLSRLVREEFP